MSLFVQGMKTHGAQIPPDLHPPKLIEQLTRVIQRAKELGKIPVPMEAKAKLCRPDQEASDID